MQARWYCTARIENKYTKLLTAISCTEIKLLIQSISSSYISSSEERLRSISYIVTQSRDAATPVCYNCTLNSYAIGYKHSTVQLQRHTFSLNGAFSCAGLLSAVYTRRRSSPHRLPLVRLAWQWDLPRLEPEQQCLRWLCFLIMQLSQMLAHLAVNRVQRSWGSHVTILRRLSETFQLPNSCQFYYVALLPRRGPHIASHSVRLSVRPVIAYFRTSVTCFRQPCGRAVSFVLFTCQGRI